MRISAIAVLTAALALHSSLLAQTTIPTTEAAQITYSVGKVSVQPGGKGDWIKASPGLTLAVGDNLWADQNSEVEIYAGATVLMVAPETSIAFDQLSASDIKLNLRLGSVIVQAPMVDESRRWEIGTPNLKFQLSESGDYRLDVNGEGNETDVTAKKGHGRAWADGTSYVVAAGQQIRFKTRDHLEIESGAIPDPDSFDVWASGRTQPKRDEEVVADIPTDASVTEAATRRVWESNGDAGHWVYTEDLGPVWVPTHWSELIILPQPVAVVLVQPVSPQETSVSFHGQYANMNGIPKPTANWPTMENISVMPTQAPSQSNNRAWPTAVRRNSDASTGQSLANGHQVQPPSHPTQVPFPHKMERPNIPTPKPPSPPSDKSKK